MLELNLGWNSLRAKGGAALAEGLKGNSVLNRWTLGGMAWATRARRLWARCWAAMRR